MTNDHFEEVLRGGLAMLAREAVPENEEVGADLPAMQALPVGDARRAGKRALAVAVAVAVALGAGVIARAAHRDSHKPRVETPVPTWARVAAFPLVARSQQSAVFTGREVLVWGGRSDSAGAVASALPGGAPYELDDGAAYDVNRDHWRVLARSPIAARYNAVATWTGSEMLVVGGQSDASGLDLSKRFLRDGAAYDAAHNRWRRIPDSPVCPMIGAWTGQELVVGGRCNIPGEVFGMAAYDPARNVWHTLPSFPNAQQLVAAGGKVFVWTGAVTNRGAVLDLHTRRWAALPALPVQETYGSYAVPYNGRFAVTGLVQPPSGTRDHAAVDILDLETARWRHYESTAVTPASGGSEVTSAPNVLLWSAGFGYSVFVGSPGAGRPDWSSSGPSPVRLAASGESLVPIGGGRFFIWGGLLAGNEHDAVNRPTREGAILVLP